MSNARLSLVLLAACSHAPAPSDDAAPPRTGPPITWTTPAGPARASIVEIGHTGRFDLVIALPGGARYTVVHLDDSRGFPQLHVRGRDLVLRRELTEYATPEVMTDEFQIVWNAAKHAPEMTAHTKGEMR